MEFDCLVIGGGPAGLAASIEAYDNGCNVAIIERDEVLGGILNQCIHNGFGLKEFGESLTGPEYAGRFITEVEKRNIKVFTKTTVLNISKDKEVSVVSEKLGFTKIKAKSIILAMGCRERSKGALNIPGTRPAGIFSAGTAQKFINLMGYMVGKKVVILGSGDIGLIMARRLTLEGAKVLAVVEINTYSSGLRRNIAQCLDDFNIPLYLSSTITHIEGKDRVSGVTISKVDENKNVIEGSDIHFDCDTVLFSVGLIPENELTKLADIKLSPRTKGAVVTQNRETSMEGVFACGNVLQVHDLVDFVSEEGRLAGKEAAKYVKIGTQEKINVEVSFDEKLSYICPQIINVKIAEDVKLYFRVRGEYRNVLVNVYIDGELKYTKKRNIVVPGEMENVIIKKDLFDQNTKNIYVELKQ